MVKPGNVLLTNCGVSTADHIYLVKTDPHRKPDDTPTMWLREQHPRWSVKFLDGGGSVYRISNRN